MKKALLVAFALSFIFFNYVKAIPAYPRKILTNINGKDCFIKVLGDEHAKRVETEEGYTIIQDESGEWRYAILDALGRLAASSYRVGTTEKGEIKAISSIPLHLSEKTGKKARRVTKISSQPIVGQRRMLIILMEFPDKHFVKTEQDFYNLFNQVDYNEDGSEGSVRDFFYRSSYGQLVLSCDIFGPYQATNRMSSYGMNSILGGGGDKNPEALFEEAIEKVSSETDLSAYDGDNDGYIDNVHLIYAGYGEEAGGPTSAIWAHEATFSKPYEIQDLKVDRYSCAAELRGNSGNGISRIGPHCHEIGHALGAMDYYDTNYSEDGLYEGTGEWDLMAAGSWNNDGITPADFNPYVKVFCFGWVNANALPEGNVVIPPSDIDGNNYYMLSHGKEYYFLENRNPQKYNKGLPGKGLLIFHVHHDIEKSESGNEINATSPQKCYVVCASANKDIPKESGEDYGNINSESCPFPGSSNNTEFSMTSIPAAFWWNNDDCGISIQDIQQTNDGNIFLNNNSYDIQQESIIASEVYFDGFETEKTYVIRSSSQSSWERVKSSGLVDMVAGRPLAYEGNYCMQLSARNSKNSSVSTLGFKTHFTDEVRTIVISGYFVSKGLKKQANQLRINWRSNKNANWESFDYEVPVNDVWSPFLLRLSPSSEMEFSVEGTAQSGSVLAIDNLKLEQQILSDVRKNRIPQISVTELYNFAGQKKTHLSKGLNIIVQKDGTTKKVYVK